MNRQYLYDYYMREIITEFSKGEVDRNTFVINISQHMRHY